MIYVLYTLAAMWALGTAGVAIYFVVEEVTFAITKVIVTLLLIPMWFVIGVIPLTYVHEKSGPKLATLLKSEWQCVNSHSEQSTTYVQSGKVMVPVTSTTDVCDAYGRIK